MNLITIEEVSTRARHIARKMDAVIEMMKEMGMEEHVIRECLHTKYIDLEEDLHTTIFKELAFQEDQLNEKINDRICRSKSQDD